MNGVSRERQEVSAQWVGSPASGWCPGALSLPQPTHPLLPSSSPSPLLCLHPSHSHPVSASGSPPGAVLGCPLCFGGHSLGTHAQGGCACLAPKQIKVEFSMKFTSRDMSLKRTPSKKQSGVFGVKISVVTK